MSISAAEAQAAKFKVGQRVSFTDRIGTYGGGRISATVTKDRGPSWEYAGRYEVQVDGADPKNLTQFLNGSELESSEQAPGKAAATGEAAAAGVNHPNAAFRIGEKVSFDDRLMRFGGGRVTATVIKDKGPSWEFASRYQVRVDGAPAGQEIQDFNGSELQKGDTGAQAPAAPQVPQQPAQAHPQAPGQAPAQPRAENNHPAPAARPAPAAVHAAGDWGHPPARGSFRYAMTDLKAPMLGNNAITPPGLKPYFVGSKPGDESPVGRWYTRTGGVFTKVGNPDPAGNQTYEWGNPEVAELINVLPGGTWQMNDHGKITTGRWYDIGQNVIRLVNMDDECDWTASVHDHMITFKGYNGLTKEGNRY